jgi:CheY-like chemotaxis protein
MPIKNGVQVVQEIKSFYREKQKEVGAINLREPLFVMLTAYKTLHFEKHVKEQGFSECYEKPIDPE